MISAEYWNPAGGLTLEPNALRAAKESGRSLALTAGPGAGKTEMLAQRADFLLRTGTCRYSKRILAISFKVDASRNLKERVQSRCGSELSARFDSYTFHAFAKRIIDRFRPILTGDDFLEAGYTLGSPKVPHKQIDFGDLVPLATKILRDSPAAKNAIRQTYSDVFLDEFQDCTNLQYELIKVAFQGTNIRLTAVGDTKQKIMGWAGALDGIFVSFAANFNAIPLNMYRNFRSKPKLLRMQNEIIRTLDPDSVMPEEQLTGHEGEIHSHTFNTCIEEAEYLASQIAIWVNDEGVPLSEVAILISKQLDLYAAPLMSALERYGIPYRNEQQLQDISVEPVAQLIVDYLLILLGSQEPAAWTRLMNLLVPFSDHDEEQSSLRQNWHKFIEAERRRSRQEPTDESFPNRWNYIVSFLQEVGLQILTALSPDYESKNRLTDVIKETNNKIDQLITVEPDLIKALSSFSGEKAVRILTIHKSKGLEFDSVVIMAIEQDIFFGNRDENRCAFFVGVSRAKRRLVLTHTASRARPNGYSGRWSTNRHPQLEYLGYAKRFLNT